MFEGGSHPVRAPRTVFVANSSVAIAALCLTISYVGWILDLDKLAALGIVGFPIWPLTVIAYALLAIGFIAATHRRRGLAYGCWAVVLALASLAVFEMVTGMDLGIDRLLFGDRVAHFGTSSAPGRIGPNPAMILVILVAAGILALRAGRTSQELASLLSGAALGLGAVATLLVIVAKPGETVSRLFASSLPGGLAATFLALAFLAWSGDFSWIKLLRSSPREWRLMRVLIVTALLLPVVPSLADVILRGRHLLSPLATEVLVVACNMTIVALLFFWAASRVARGQAELTRLTEALDSASVAITDLEGRIVHWSRGCEQLYGWPAEEAIGRDKYGLLHSRCEQRWRGAVPTRAGQDAQEMIEIRRDGREVAVIERVHRVDPPGIEPLLVLSMTDITRGAEAMAALRRTEERLSVAAAAHELGVFEWDVKSGRLEWSPGAEQRLGLEPGTVRDFDSWRARVYPEDFQNTLDTIARAVSERASRFSFRYRFKERGGNMRSVEGSARTFYDVDGNLLRTVGVMIDTTARDEREAALRSREAQLRTVLETVPDAMLVMNERGLIREFSNAAEDLWGYRAQDVIGEHFSMLSPESDRDRYVEALRAFQNYPYGPHRFIGHVITGTGEAADGRRFPVEIRTGVARTGDGTMFTVFFRDVSERLATEERLSDLNAELAHVSRQSAMSEMAADLAHELNQPLSATANFLAAARMLLEKGEDTARAADLVRMGGDQTLRAGEIIRRLRSFMSRREVEMRTESVEQTVRDAAELVLVGTGQFDIRVNFDLDPAVPVMFADRVQVQQVLVNLLRNSMQALRSSNASQREIVIASRPAPDTMIEITVRDSGPGLPQSILDHLYTRFVTTKGTGGMGIGLSISRRIVEAHGGTLTAENLAEGGACFRFTLPAKQEEEA